MSSVLHGNQSFLYKLIKNLSRDRGFHICIHNTSGIIHNAPNFQLPLKHYIHSCAFCETAKSTSIGFNFCTKCKSYTIKKALKKKETFTGQCYLGITEIIEPVFWDDKLICIIYLGNMLLEEQKSEVYRKIKKSSNISGVKEEKLLQSLKTVHPLTKAMLEEYKEIVEIIGNFILLNLESNLNLLPKTQIRNTNWIIDSVKNHIFLYSNRDIKLLNLSKLYFIHPDYLCKLFKKETGMNFSDYVNDTRIANAKRLLELTNDTIMDVSTRVGFNNVTYFNKTFKKYTGLTPREYRNNHLRKDQ